MTTTAFSADECPHPAIRERLPAVEGADERFEAEVTVLFEAVSRHFDQCAGRRRAHRSRTSWNCGCTSTRGSATCSSGGDDIVDDRLAEEHAAKEEAYEFRYLRRAVPAGELRTMAALVQAAEAVAPTRPHPGVESAAANTVAGPVLSLFDRTTDLVRDALATSK